MSSLQAIASPGTDHPLAVDVILRYNTLCSNNHVVLFCWILSHTRIKGNFEAKKGAKSALTQIPLPASDFTPSIKHYINNLWQGLWNSYPDNKLYKIHPTINIIPAKHVLIRKDPVIVNRLLIMHSYLTHIHLLTKDPPPTCNNCAYPLTIQHILTDCSICQHI